MRRFQLLFVPLTDLEGGERELDRFLGSHRVLSVREEFVQAEGYVGWSFCIGYETGTAPAQVRIGAEGKRRASTGWSAPDPMCIRSLGSSVSRGRKRSGRRCAGRVRGCERRRFTGGSSSLRTVTA